MLSFEAIITPTGKLLSTIILYVSRGIGLSVFNLNSLFIILKLAIVSDMVG